MQNTSSQQQSRSQLYFKQFLLPKNNLIIRLMFDASLFIEPFSAKYFTFINYNVRVIVWLSFDALLNFLFFILPHLPFWYPNNRGIEWVYSMRYELVTISSQAAIPLFRKPACLKDPWKYIQNESKDSFANIDMRQIYPTDFWIYQFIKCCIFIDTVIHFHSAPAWFQL